MTANCPFIYDEQDAGLVAAHKWHVRPKNNTSYVVRTVKVGGRRSIYLHREIMNADAYPHLEVDHINRNGLDNRRENLRLVTHAENAANNGQAVGCSGYRGVWKVMRGERWMAVIKRNGKRKYLGVFDTPELASAAWQEAANGTV